MKNKTWLQERAESKIGKPSFETQRLLLRLTEEFAARMDERKVRRAHLARELSVDRSMVTRILNGDQNVTIKTLVSMASALDCRLNFELQDLRETRADATQTPGHMSSVAAILEIRERPLLQACRDLPGLAPFHGKNIHSAGLPFSEGGVQKRNAFETFTIREAPTASLNTTLTDNSTVGGSATTDNVWKSYYLKGECDAPAA